MASGVWRSRTKTMWSPYRWSALQSTVVAVAGTVSRYHLVNSKLPTNAKAITKHKRQKLLIICECFGGRVGTDSGGRLVYLGACSCPLGVGVIGVIVCN